MKLINAGDVAVNQFGQHVYNCNLNVCQKPYSAPYPNAASVQLYAFFGSVKPNALTITLIDRCGNASPEVVSPVCYSIARSKYGWYGVFRGFADVTFDVFVVALQATFPGGSKTMFFSQDIAIQNDCEQLTEVSVCYPTDFNDLDPNGIYVGLPISDPDNGYTIEGRSDIMYMHRYWVRDGHVVETAGRIDYVSNATQNFNSKYERLFEFRCELVPGWYKDYLTAVYLRGNFNISDSLVLASELVLENINEDGDLWKPYIRLKKEYKANFGCELPECPVDACGCVPPVIRDAFFNAAEIGVPYTYSMFITQGTGPFTINIPTKPAWLTAEVVDSTIEFSGTPDATGTFEVYFTITNACGTYEVDTTISVLTVGGCLPVSLDLQPWFMPYSLGVPYNMSLILTGSPPFALTVNAKPDWMDVTLVGNTLFFTGIPLNHDTNDIDVVVNNCATSSVSIEHTLLEEPLGGRNFFMENNASSGSIEDLQPEFYLIDDGKFPIGAGDAAIEGWHRGGYLDLAITVAGPVFGKRINIHVDEELVRTVEILTPGTYLLNPERDLYFEWDSEVLIELTD